MASKWLTLVPALLALTACGEEAFPTPKDPATANVVAVDRFGEGAMLQKRDATNSTGLPLPNAPVNFDQGPFITRGLGPNGEKITYYNFDVQPAAPAPIYVLFEEGSTTPVAGQLNIIDVIPGQAGYSDFWLVTKVTVPKGYVANTVTSLSEITSRGFAFAATTEIVNCPVVPDGSTAKLRGGGESAGLTTGWYRGQAVKYFNFLEAKLKTAGGSTPVSPIYVTFNANPDAANGGPKSGFRTEPGTQQTHNVAATLPSSAAYSPLWSVNIYDTADFSKVSNLQSVTQARLLASGAALVNCPIVAIQ